MSLKEPGAKKRHLAVILATCRGERRLALPERQGPGSPGFELWPHHFLGVFQLALSLL